MSNSDPEDSSGDSKVPVLVSILGLIVIVYVGGAFSAAFKTFPYPQMLAPPFKALAARMEKRSSERADLPLRIWQRVQHSNEGVVTSSEGALEGYTLYASSHSASAFLIDMQGEVVHEWSGPFREVWPEAPHVDDPVPPKNIYWRHMHLFDNGDLLVVYAGIGDTPWGYGLAKFDRHSEVVWTYDERVHHYVDVTDDGTIYALVHRFRNTEVNPVRGLPHLPTRIMEDFIVKLSPEGDELDRISLLEALAQSDYLGALQMHPEPNHTSMEAKWNPLHTNAVEVVGEAFARHHEAIDPEDLMFSSRNTNLVGCIDPATEEIVWATRGFWSEQHDPDPRPNGRIMVFDNNGHAGPGGRSRIVEYDPRTNRLPWIYPGTRRQPFQSVMISSQQPLANGNILITSSFSGRIFEVTRQGEIVWEFYNPVRRRPETTSYIPIVLDAQRFEPEELSFLSDGSN